MAVLEGPASVRIATPLDQCDRLGDTRVGRIGTGGSEMLEAPEDVVEIPGREGELEPARVDHLAGRLPAEELALEHVLLAAAASRADLGGATRRPLMLEEALEDVDRRPERRDRRAVLDLAVPATVGELLAQEPLDQRRHVHAEIRT